MKIWVDADAAPGDVKRILFKAAERAQVPLTLVANVPLRHPDSRYITSKVVEDGFNIADDWIAEQCEPGDLVITADIPLADRVIERGATAIDPRGTVYTENNIKGKLATRDQFDDLRGASLVEGGGPPPYTKKDVHKFASAFQTLLARRR